MTIQTKQDLSQAASRLHRLLKNQPADGPWSHNKALELLAKALGFQSAAALQAKLPDAPEEAKGASRRQKHSESLRLANTSGWLDLVEPGQSGTIAHGITFEEATGTIEDIFSCVAYANEGRREAGKLSFDYVGETRIEWDCQKTRRNEEGHTLWDFDGECLAETQCVLVPTNFEDPHTQEQLPVREKLVVHYLKAARRLKLDEALLAKPSEMGAYAQLREEIGFGLHAREKEHLMQLLQHS